MAVEGRHSGLVSNEVEFAFLKATRHHDIPDDADGEPTTYPRQFETASMKMPRMDIIAALWNLRRQRRPSRSLYIGFMAYRTRIAPIAILEKIDAGWIYADSFRSGCRVIRMTFGACSDA